MVFLNTCLKQDTSGPSKSSPKTLEKEAGLFSDGIMRRSQAISPTSVMVRITSGVWDALVHLCHTQQISKCFMNNSEVNSWPRGTKMLLPKENYGNSQTLGSSCQPPFHGSKVLSLPSGAGGGFFSIFYSSPDEASSLSIHKSILHTSSRWLNRNSEIQMTEYQNSSSITHLAAIPYLIQNYLKAENFPEVLSSQLISWGHLRVLLQRCRCVCLGSAGAD